MYRRTFSTLYISALQDLVNHLTQAETFITRAQSLLTKFEAGKAGQHPTQADLAQFVSDLLQMPEVTIPGAARAPAGKVIHALFAAAQKVCAVKVCKMLLYM